MRGKKGKLEGEREEGETERGRDGEREEGETLIVAASEGWQQTVS